jgi:hypothetical protein
LALLGMIFAPASGAHANACNAALEHEISATLALVDVETDRADSPVVLSRAITGAPTLETLRADLDAAQAEVLRACRQGPTR